MNRYQYVTYKNRKADNDFMLGFSTCFIMIMLAVWVLK